MFFNPSHWNSKGVSPVLKEALVNALAVRMRQRQVSSTPA
jgi:hypothetical protein